MLDRNRRSFALDHPIWLHLGLIAIAIAFALPLCRRAIILSDEGYLLQQALDLLDGRVLYRDMDAFITPGMWFTIAGVFALFGPSVLVSRLLILAAYVALVLVTFRIVTPMTSCRYGLSAVAGILLFSVWAFPAWTFAFYSPVAVLLALAALERLLAWSRTRRTRDLLLVGLLLGLSVCFKQNYGVFAIVGAAAGYLAIKLDSEDRPGPAFDGAPREMAIVAGGVVLAGLPFLVYLLVNGAMPAAWQSLVVHPFEFGGKHDIPYAALSDIWKPDLWTTGIEKLTYLSYASLRGGSLFLIDAMRGGNRLHALAYWLPPLIVALGAVLSLVSVRGTGRRIDGRLFATVSTCGMVFLGVLPRADFNHLVNVYQPIIVLAPIVVFAAVRALDARPMALRAGVLALAIFIGGLYGSVAIHWYGVLLRTHTTPLSSPRAGVLVPRFEADDIDAQVDIITRSTRPGDAVLTLPDLSMLNFLADRRVPSAYYNLYEHHIAMDEGAAVVAASEMNGVQLAVTRYDNFFSDRRGLLDYAPKLAQYLLTHYRRVMIGANEDFIVFKRRALPEPPSHASDAFAQCVPEGGGSELRSHLLFKSLYHKPLHRRSQDEALLTPCRLDVPTEGGVLSLELGYRQPYAASRDAGLQAGVFVTPEDGGTRERLYEETLRVVAQQGAVMQPPYRRLDLDLSPWAGKSVILEFETTTRGRVKVHPLDFKGFALVWRDAKLHSGPNDQRP